jgi:hypothetical protein
VDLDVEYGIGLLEGKLKGNCASRNTKGNLYDLIRACRRKGGLEDVWSELQGKAAAEKSWKKSALINMRARLMTCTQPVPFFRLCARAISLIKATCQQIQHARIRVPDGC